MSSRARRLSVATATATAEKAAEAGDLGGARAAIPDLECEVGKLCQVLDEIVTKTGVA